MEQKHDLVEMAYYINMTRPDQLVQIKSVTKTKVWYEVLSQYDKNPINEFCCTRERFNNLYRPKK